MESNPYATAKAWAAASALTLAAAVAFLPKSYMTDYFIMLWALTGGLILYRSRQGDERISPSSKTASIALGILSCILSFAAVPLGLGKPPFSLDDITLLLAGASLAFFAVWGHGRLLLPATIPIIVVLGYQILGARTSGMDILVGPTTTLIYWIASALGLSPSMSGNIISFLTADGTNMRVSIVPDCTGIWSLTAYVLAFLMVAILVPGITRRGYVFFLIGLPVTYLVNLARVVLIIVAIYYFGPSWGPQMAHAHLGWIVFSAWMMAFWYLFFSRGMHCREPKA